MELRIRINNLCRLLASLKYYIQILPSGERTWLVYKVVLVAFNEEVVGFLIFWLRPVCFCFDYCCVPFVVDLNVLDISFHCILQSILPWSGGYRGDITTKRITDTDRQYSAWTSSKDVATVTKSMGLLRTVNSALTCARTTDSPNLLAVCVLPQSPTLVSSLSWFFFF